MVLNIPKPIEQIDKNEIARKKMFTSLTTHVLSYLTNAFLARGFRWYLPVVISKSTDPLWPDPGASIEKRVEFEIYGSGVRTTLSMIVHKIVACSLFSERLFSISPNIRIEKRDRASTGWHAYEFNQLDFEIRDASSKDVMNLIEELFSGLISHMKKNFPELIRNRGTEKISLPFEVIDREDLQAKYGKEWEEILPTVIKRPVWVVNIPREFYDFQDFKTGKWDNYDLYLPDYGEVLSGARREFEYEKIVSKMERDGVRKENYEVLLKLAKERRLKQSAGAGIGIERLITWLSGSKHVCEVQPFPRVPGLVYEL
jgi:asparaginyl-tRNA synthetase